MLHNFCCELNEPDLFQLQDVDIYNLNEDVEDQDLLPDPMDGNLHQLGAAYGLQVAQLLNVRYLIYIKDLKCLILCSKILFTNVN
jgi:hypothetical protein